MGRRYRNDNCGRFELFSAQTALGVHFVRKISMREGDDLVTRGKAKLVFDEDSRCYLYQLVDEGAKSWQKAEFGSRPSCPVLSRAEAEAAAGDFGKSATAGLNNEGRKLLEAVNREAHDFIERSTVKLNTFKPRGTAGASALAR